MDIDSASGMERALRAIMDIRADLSPAAGGGHADWRANVPQQGRSKTCAGGGRSYSMTSSARACSVSGTVRPSALAVLS
jgi:hypothetical protein